MKLGPRSLATALAVILAATTLSVCGKKSPSDSTPATPPPTTAPPATQPTPAATTCSRLGYVSPSNNCGSDAASFQPQVEQALSQLVAQHPEIFILIPAGETGGIQMRHDASCSYPNIPKHHAHTQKQQNRRQLHRVGYECVNARLDEPPRRIKRHRRSVSANCEFLNGSQSQDRRHHQDLDVQT